MVRIPRWSYPEPPDFDGLIADGAADGRRRVARRTRRALTALLSAVLLLCAAAGGGYAVLSSRAAELERERAVMADCSRALGRLSALESRAARARRRMDDAVSRMDQSYDLDRLTELSRTPAPAVPSLSCSADPSKASKAADRAAAGLSDWLEPVEAALGGRR